MTIDTIQIESLSKRETTELFQEQLEAKLDTDDLIALIEAQENYPLEKFAKHMKIEEKELQQLSQQRPLPAKVREALSKFLKYDTNKNGILRSHEFISLMGGYPNSIKMLAQ